MTPATLAATAEALYGRWWQAALAEAYGVSPRTVRRWAAGTSGIPEDMMDWLRLRCVDKADELDTLALELIDV